jgi:hypothetical protein
MYNNSYRHVTGNDGGNMVKKNTKKSIKKKSNNNEAKILVEIASYRDPELMNTVKSAIIQADNPDRVYFSICYQNDDIKVLDELKQIKNCKVKHLWESQAKGSCYARYLCQQMIDDEEYIFQVDSHMRFVKHWDNKMIERLLSLNDPKACISFYPPSCTEEMMTLPLDDKKFDEPGFGGIMYTTGFRPNSIFTCSYSTSIDSKSTKAPAKNPIISAGNFFSFSDVHREVLHDPEMYFYGDEMPMAVRIYTHGWNNYTDNVSYVYHQYERKNQVFPPVRDSDANEIRRFKRLINLDNENYDMGEFGLGTERTIKQFEEFSGIIYSKRLVYKDAELGNFDKPKMDKKVSFLKKRKSIEELDLQNREKIEIILIDIRGDVEECIKSFNSKLSGNHDISYLVGTNKSKKLSDKFIKDNNIRELGYFNEGAIYSGMLSSLIPKLDSDSYALVIDSAVRPMKDWDKYSINMIKKCGTKGALTNWVWRVNKDTDVEALGPYNNIIKEFDMFYYFVPIYKFNTSIKLELRDKPYKTPFISDGFLFIKSSNLKKMNIDPRLKYEEQKYVLSTMLWTNGIDVYYPPSSFFYRIDDENSLNIAGINHYEILSALFSIDNQYSKSMDANYKYLLGKERPLWEWYEYIGFDVKSDKTFDI